MAVAVAVLAVPVKNTMQVVMVEMVQHHLLVVPQLPMQVVVDVDHMLVLRQPAQVAQVEAVPAVYHLSVALVQSTQVAVVVAVDTPVDLEISRVAAPAAQVLLLFPTHLVTMT